ncbi:AMP-binding protein [Sphingosinicella sp.]|uniref:AMP-binding protein n=1 Tax=Sphingosinicella sp. TaxID=1917971 RepID=UPI0018442777|nr:AMP-binding protein [Sphingosinicella sp.]MBA4758740.1 AMP-binding protein [Sphingosinicella sp.]
MAIEARSSVYLTFAAAAQRWAARPFLHAPADAICEPLPFEQSFAEAAGAVETLRAAYGKQGYGNGHRIGLALDNHPAFFLHFLSLNALGASVVPLNTAMRPEEMAPIVAAADLDAIVAWPKHRAMLENTQTLSGTNVPVAEPSLADLPSAVRDAREDDTPDADREAAMLFTSGTTGKPKGCILSNAYFTWVGHFYATLGGHCAFREGEDRILTPLPVNHMNALACSFMAAMMTGSCLIQLDRFHASRWWDTVRETRASVIHYLGVMPAILLQRDDETAGLDVRFGFGAGVDPRHHARFEERFGFPLIEAWAMTETGAAAWITANREPRHIGTRCFGRAPDHLDVRIVDDAGADVPDGVPGELLVRARGDDPRRHFFSGYYRDPAATEVAWEGGWFHTGDIVKRDAEGNFFFVDRSKNIVRRSGENIAAVEVEGVLMQHASVAACAVLPIEDELRGEEVMALVQTDESAAGEALAIDLVNHCLERLAYFKAPGYIAFVDHLPTTASQKLQRGEIRSLGRELHAKGKAFDMRARKRGPKAA